MSEETKGGGGSGSSWMSASEYQRAIRQAASRKAEVARLASEIAALTTERDTLKTQVGALTTERDDWKKKLEEAPAVNRAEVDRLAKLVRDRDHKDAFVEILSDADLAKSLSGRKLRPDALAALMTVGGYKPEEHEGEDGKPLAEKIKGFITGAAQSAPWAFEAAESAARVPQPGPAGGRGIPAPRASERKTASQAIDASWAALGRDDDDFRL